MNWAKGLIKTLAFIAVLYSFFLILKHFQDPFVYISIESVIILILILATTRRSTAFKQVVLDGNSFLEEEKKQGDIYVIKGDGHPTALVNERFARYLLDNL